LPLPLIMLSPFVLPLPLPFLFPVPFRGHIVLCIALLFRYVITLLHYTLYCDTIRLLIPLSG
jgi:hypothetical protein